MPNAPLAPVNVLVTLDRLPLSADDLRSLSALEVHESADRSTSVRLTFNGRDALGRAPAFLDDPRFQVGAAVAISLGSPPRPVMLGDITRARAELVPDGGASLTLEGYGLRHRLGRASETHTWTNVTDSGIAAQIARKHGLVPRGDTTTTVFPRVEQLNTTDLEFLSGRAAAIDFDLWVDGDELWFSPVEHRRASTATLAADELLSLETTVDATDLLDTVNVPWTDVRSGQHGVVTVRAQELGDTLSTRLKALWGSRSVWLDGVAASADAARKAATARLRQGIEEHHSLTASCRGRPELRVGTRVALTGLGSALGGEVVVIDATHTVSGAEYRTTFTGRRLA